MPFDNTPGEEMHSWMRDLFPIMRSLTGEGVRQTVAYLQELMPDLQLRQVASGSSVLDWTVPDEWTFREAYLETEDGQRIVDAAVNRLHVLGYSEPVDAWFSRNELEPYLHSLPAMPDAIPYVTSYYKRRWGFCLPDTVRRALPDTRYHARIDTELKPGVLNYADLVIPGDSDREIMISTYICHPQMANNELSGPVVATALARWVASLPNRRHTFRFVFVPETIGAITYLSRHIDHLKEKVVAGFVMTCCGDERSWSFMPSRKGGTLADRAALHVLNAHGLDVKTYSFLERGSDERQYCAPGVDMPFVSVMRSKYGEYPEYHTSADDLELATPAGLAGTFAVMQDVIRLIEANRYYRMTTLGEPQLGKRGLYRSLSTLDVDTSLRHTLNIVAYADGSLDLIDLSDKIGAPATLITEVAARLIETDAMVASDGPSG